MYVFDLEGTLSDCLHRNHLIPDKSLPKEERDYASFHSQFPKDLPNWPMIRIYRSCATISRIIILTGMSEIYREQAERWLRLKAGITCDELVMRQVGDMRTSPNFKLEYLMKQDHPIHMVFDDRFDVINKLAEHNIPAVKV